jgi:CRISPR-associated protein Cas2
MRVVVFFDLPVLTVDDRREYRRFRKYLIKQGFVMIQESAYAKLTLNGIAAKTIEQNVQKHAPPMGLVELLMVTEKQFANIKYITGKNNSEYITTTDRVVIV